MNVLVTGAFGNLASAFIPLLRDRKDNVILTAARFHGQTSFHVYPLDVCDNSQVLSTFERFHPELVLHLAALTNVDYCELHPEEAFRINAVGTKNIVLACRQFNAELVYVSTAQVFDGEKETPYTELDVPKPINVYGQSKLEGEKAVQSSLNQYFIVRTAWLMGGGKNDKKFAAKIVRLLETEKELKVIDDKIGSPTFVTDLAKNILEVIQAKCYGIYHIASRGSCSRYQMAQKIREILGRKEVRIIPASSRDFPLPAPRGISEVLVNDKLELLGLNLMPSWQEAVENYLKSFYVQK